MITRTPRDAASWVASPPALPAAPVISSVGTSVGHADYLVTDRGRRAVADLLDHPGHVEAGNDRERRVRVHSRRSTSHRSR